MFFHITIHRIKAYRVSDHPADPFDRSIELYQTWHLAALEDISATSPSPWARQGSSARGAPDDGMTVREGDDVVTVDPQITLGMADTAFQAGATAQYRLDFHHWDSDSSTEKVRAAFTDVTLKYMVAAFQAANGDAQQARAALEAWIRGNWKDGVRAIATAVAPTSPWVAVGVNLLPMLELLVDVLRNDSDDYFAMARFILQHKGTGNGITWQVTDPAGIPSGWMGHNQLVEITSRVMDGPRANILDVSYRFRLVA